MADFDLEKLIAQKAEARGDDGKHVSFDFAGREWTFRDPLMLDDDEKLELNGIEGDEFIAAWYMGDDQYDDFTAATAKITLKDGRVLEYTGNSSIFFQVFREYMRKAQAVDEQGNGSRPNRSSRRMAQKKSKQH